MNNASQQKCRAAKAKPKPYRGFTRIMRIKANQRLREMRVLRFPQSALIRENPR
jgi:hypothetical protein